MDDVRAVIEAAASREAAIYGDPEGGPMSLLFAVTYPSKVIALVLYGTFARFLKTSDYPLSPSGAIQWAQSLLEIDVRALLPVVRAPTLVLHRRGDRACRFEGGKFIAQEIPGAKFVELVGKRPRRMGGRF
jgi:pimeloyl-ACP methyl ester carboxylesterase